jgi:WD40 repeat protein
MAKHLKPSLQFKVPGVSNLSLSPQGNLLAGIKEHQELILFNRKDGSVVRTLGPFGLLTDIVFAPDGSSLATCSWEDPTQVFDTKKFAPLHKFGKVGHSVAYSPDGKWLAVGEKKDLRVYDLKTGQARFATPTKRRVDLIVYSPDGKTLATGPNRETPLWDASTGSALCTLNNKGDIMTMRFSPDGKYLATCGSGDGALLWNLKSRRAVTMEHDDTIYNIEFSPDGKHIATAGGDNVVKIWSAPDGKELKMLQTGEDSIFFASFSPSGKHLLTISFANETKLWETKSWSEIATIDKQQGVGADGCTAPAWYPGGKRFALGGGSEIAVYDV